MEGLEKIPFQSLQGSGTTPEEAAERKIRECVEWVIFTTPLETHKYCSMGLR
jgi:hypothetical protein